MAGTQASELVSPVRSPNSSDARVVRDARKQVCAGAADAAGLRVRSLVLASWLRSRESGVDRVRTGAPIVLSAEELRARRANNRLIDAALPVTRLLADAFPSVLVLADPDGCMLEVLGSNGLVRDAARLNVVPGARWSEPDVGTDAVALCCALGTPVQIHWSEHYLEMSDPWAGSAVPLCHPHTGKLAGVLSLYGRTEVARPATLRTLQMAAAEIEAGYGQRLMAARARLLERFTRHMAAQPHDAIIGIDDDGVILAVSSGAVSLLTASRDEIWGRSLFELPELSGAVRRPSAAGVPFELERGMRSAGALDRFMPVVADSDAHGSLVRLVPHADPRSRPRAVRTAWPSAYTFEDIVGESPAMVEAKRRAARAAARDLPVLLLGESGTGKELFAHGIHHASARRGGPFLPVNCAALTDELLAAELFGYEEGAFTGALRGGRAGKVELADGGTLFLDEVEEMSPRMQAHLLRVLEDSRVVRVGSARPRPVDVRIIAVSNGDLDALVASGRFRRDLFHRLGVLTLRLPALRERRSDLPLLIDHLLRRLGVHAQVDATALRMLAAHDWPGNVRELRNALLQAGDATPDGTIRAEHFASVLPTPAPRPASAPRTLLAQAEKDVVIDVLARSGGNLARAAAMLGVHRVTLYRKMKAHGIVRGYEGGGSAGAGACTPRAQKP
ncbi:MAG: sigma-54-dependent Fis family transcriptional regulator [Candidatus Binatia bacterium]